MLNLTKMIVQKRARERRQRKADLVSEQVKKLMTDVDQKLILMVRG